MGFVNNITKRRIKKIKDEFIEKYLPSDITAEEKDTHAVKN